MPHINKELVLNVDVKDFFPSIHFKRVKGLLQKLGYSEKIATILSLLCTEAITDEVEIDNKTYFVQKGDRVLPQGAPTSPAITNILCFKLDKRLEGLANKAGCNYTRYADDITFSGNKEIVARQLVWRIKKILKDEGFVAHAGKIRVMRKGSLQEVTGLVVNQRLGVNRKKLREFRSLLHHLEKGDSSKLQSEIKSLPYSVIGYANFVKMVNPLKAVALQKTITRLFQNKILQYPVNAAESSKNKKSGGSLPVNGSTEKEAGNNPWWKVV